MGMPHLRILALMLLTGCLTSTAEAPRAQAAPEKTQPGPLKPPELSLKRLDGQPPWHLSDERGHVVLLDVWATWCEPCRDSLPLYNELEAQFRARGLKVFAINVDEDSSQIAKFLSEVKVTVPVLIDPGALSAESELHVKLMPTAFLIDRAGKVREVHEGFSEDAKATYQSQIEALLAEGADQ